METDVNAYNFVTTTDDVLELYNFDVDVEDAKITYVVCSNCVKAEGKTLNTEYRSGEDLRKFSPEIFVEKRVDDSNDAVQLGRVRIEVVDKTNTVVGEREEAISDLGHSVRPGYGFVPYVYIDGGVKPEDVSEVRVFIVCE